MNIYGGSKALNIPKGDKSPRVIYTKDKILTGNPLYNDVLNRAEVDIKNRELSRLASKVNRIDEKIGETVADLNRQIEESRNEEKRLKSEREQARKSDVFLYLEARKGLNKQKETTAELIRKRDNIITAELSPEEYREMITTVLSEYDRDRKKRRAEIVKQLAVAEELINELYNQSEATGRLLSALGQFNGTKHKAVWDKIETPHRDNFGGIRVGESLDTIKVAHSIRDMKIKFR